MDGWMDGWMEGREIGVKDCLQQSKKEKLLMMEFIAVFCIPKCLKQKHYHLLPMMVKISKLILCYQKKKKQTLKMGKKL